MGEMISFPSTHWSLVSLAGREDKEGMREALGRILRLYSPALRAHLERLQKRVMPDAVEEMVSAGFYLRQDHRTGFNRQGRREEG